MLQIDNRTPFNAALAVFADPRGVETAYVAVKAAFNITPDGLVPTFKPLPLLPGDVFWGDPATTGLRGTGAGAGAAAGVVSGRARVSCMAGPSAGSRKPRI